MQFVVNKQDFEVFFGGYCFDVSLSVFGIFNVSGESLEFLNIIGDIFVGGFFFMFVIVQEQISVGENCYSQFERVVIDSDVF